MHIQTVFKVDGYQEISIEQDKSGSVFLYMGDNFVAFTLEQWAIFVDTMREVVVTE